MDMKQIYQLHEARKMKKYNRRIIQVEKGTFTLLIYSTSGGWGPQASKYHKRLAEKLSEKRGEDYALCSYHVLHADKDKILYSQKYSDSNQR
jgi:hypothetical protein